MTAAEIIEKYQLIPHPEGGFYREMFRSDESKNGYQLGTSIYFLITKENVSRFHRIQQDELWFHHYGASIEIHLLHKDQHHILELGSPSETANPYHLVSKNVIFGSCLKPNSGEFALVSCVVIPGFEFKDFELFSFEQLLKDFPNHSEIIEKLT